MDRRVKISAFFLEIIHDKDMSFLGKVITMDELAISMHMPEIENSQNNG